MIHVGGETLHEDAVDAVVAHPAEMAADGLGIVGRDDLGGGAAVTVERQAGAVFGRGLRDVGQVVGERLPHAVALARVVAPARFGGVVRRAEPALIAAEDATVKGGMERRGGGSQRGEEDGGSGDALKARLHLVHGLKVSNPDCERQA